MDQPTENVPVHLAIIMDGNGRWAAARGLSRNQGHRAGMDAIRKAVRATGELGIRHLTLYAFSSENWSRPAREVSDLFGLIKVFIARDLGELCDNGVHIRVIGSREGLSKDVIKMIEVAEARSRDNTAFELNVAFNYGGRDEIRRVAVAVLQRLIADGCSPDALTEADIAAALDTRGQPDPDLLIRTSGEMRLSNFLLWQTANSECVFLPCMWPDFDKSWLLEAVTEFSARKSARREMTPDLPR